MRVIYLIQASSDPEKCYVGSTKDYKARQLSHVNKLKANAHPNAKLQAYVNEHSVEDLIFSVLEDVIDKSQLLTREQHYINVYNPFFNISKVAGSSLGIVRTQEFKDKVSKAKKGKKHSPEANAAKSIRQKGWQNALGFKHTEEAKAKISANSAKRHPVRQLTLDGQPVREWAGMMVAAKELNLHYQSINACINGRIKQTGGFRWESKRHEINPS